jgi:eukaryotic-like serine/threonine-protein kinase
MAGAEEAHVAGIRQVFVHAGSGLAAAHQVGLVHRDFKPDNVLIRRDERPRVADFELARVASEGPSSGDGHETPAHATSWTSPLTELGKVMGTPRFMPPEQILAEALDGRTDQFSFAVALYEAFYGVPPASRIDRAREVEAWLAARR